MKRNISPTGLISLLILLALLPGCAAPTAALPTVSQPPAATAPRTTAPVATTSTPEFDVMATAKVQTAVVAETAQAATQAVVTPTPSAPVAAVLSLWPEDLVWLPAGQPFMGKTYPTVMLVARNGANFELVNPVDGQSVFTGAVTLPDTPLALSPDASTLLALADGGPDKSAPSGPGPFPINAYYLDGSLRFTLSNPTLTWADYTQDGKYILAQALADKPDLLLFDPNDGKLVRELSGFETAAPVYTGYIAPGGKTAVWQSRATVQLQDVESGAMGAKMQYQDFVTALAISPDGTRVAVGVPNQLALYSLPDGAELASVAVSQPISSLTFSPDGKVLAAGYGADIQLWDGATLVPGDLLRGPNTFTSMVTFSPDGAYLAALHEGQMLTIRAIMLE